MESGGSEGRTAWLTCTGGPEHLTLPAAAINTTRHTWWPPLALAGHAVLGPMLEEPEEAKCLPIHRISTLYYSYGCAMLLVHTRQLLVCPFAVFVFSLTCK